MKRMTAGFVLVTLLTSASSVFAADATASRDAAAKPLVKSYAELLKSKSGAVAPRSKSAKEQTTASSGGGRTMALLWTLVGTGASVAATAYYLKSVKQTTEGAR
ncbi:MAG TPA: hypothetical protein VH583_11320 [Vicinamibacterales bacterium]|jgi:hypothetical protein